MVNGRMVSQPSAHQRPSSGSVASASSVAAQAPSDVSVSDIRLPHLQPSSGPPAWFSPKLPDHWTEPPTHVDAFGGQFWENADGQLHRLDDRPAAIYPRGYAAYYIDGVLHRGGGRPALVDRSNGRAEWWIGGKRHRAQDKPAIIRPNGSREWFRWGERHRDGDQPAVITEDGTHREWWRDGMRDRGADKPAVIYSDRRAEWWRYGELDRQGGKPAVVSDTILVWYANGLIHRGGDLPAHASPECREWYRGGRRHRDGDKPAIVNASTGCCEWWKDDVLTAGAIRPDWRRFW